MKRNNLLIKKALERDDFTCQKCKLQDKTVRTLEIHHITPLIFEGRDELNNLITLCRDCHHFAPNRKQDFEEYLKEECTGTMSNLLKAIQKTRKEHPELFDKVQNKLKNL